MTREGSLGKIPVRAEGPATGKCGLCTGKCCTYVNQQIDGPRSMADFDQLLWQIAHHNIQVYRDADGWFMIYETRCRFLETDGRCGIYATRPQICRNYDNDHCEYDEPAEKHFDLHFETYEQLDKYCRKRFRNWDRRFTATR
jgi:hypothetical protein